MLKGNDNIFPRYIYAGIFNYNFWKRVSSFSFSPHTQKYLVTNLSLALIVQSISKNWCLNGLLFQLFWFLTSISLHSTKSILWMPTMCHFTCWGQSREQDPWLHGALPSYVLLTRAVVFKLQSIITWGALKKKNYNSWTAPHTI